MLWGLGGLELQLVAVERGGQGVELEDGEVSALAVDGLQGRSWSGLEMKEGSCKEEGRGGALGKPRLEEEALAQAGEERQAGRAWWPWTYPPS